ncbi:MerR family transcriptional regulator [Promicromonospora sukumoe]|uniref:MerR family transcriptional regulator n=1 Tax=Promicromonospora sukumoe TaxID=88382 RepID=UPI00037EBCB2|nr:MerR family transcriptional regulator [Promicromonospora sukumoe]
MTPEVSRPLRTADVARESGWSVQQVRDLERLGVIPPATRAANGYRSYAPVHVQALRAYRGLASAAGPVDARRLLAEALTGSVADAAAAVGAVHVRLARDRDEALRAREALGAIQREATEREATEDGVTKGEAIEVERTGAARAGRPAPADPASADPADVLTITQLAAALGVRTSTLRFWEQEGLVAPERVTSLRARQYGPAAVNEARIVAALRASGYGVPAVRDVVAMLRRLPGVDEGIARAGQILDRRLDQIAARTVALLRAGTDLADLVTSRGA